MKTAKTIILVGLGASIVIASALGGALADRLFVIKPLDYLLKRQAVTQEQILKVVSSDSVVVDTADKASGSVVTVAIVKDQPQYTNDSFSDPFGFFGGFGMMPQPQATPQTQLNQLKQDIGSGFVVERGGIIVTNKHVVSDTGGKYRVIDKNDKEYEVKQIYRDPSNDLALLKIDADLPPLALGDSSSIKVGQSVIAIGTALGEFRHTVTTGVISGLGRGIDASAGFGGAERLDGVIQTDAAINPGNSGGPLLNYSGEVVGVNVAVAAGAQNIGFALPINVVKDSLKEFDATGKFSRPFLGIRYKMVDKNLAILNNVAAGAYVMEVIDPSPAKNAGLKAGDIVTSLGGEAVDPADNNSLTKIIAKHKAGEKLQVEFVRDGKKQTLDITLQESSG